MRPQTRKIAALVKVAQDGLPRTLTPEEEEAIAQGEKKWFISARADDPGGMTLVSPWRRALMTGALGALAGGSIGLATDTTGGEEALEGTLFGGGTGALLGAILGHSLAEHRNRRLRSLIRRLPPNATAGELAAEAERFGW